MVARAVALASVAMALTMGTGLLPRAADAIGPDAAERAALRALEAGSQNALKSIVFGSSAPIPSRSAVEVARLSGGANADATGTTSGPLAVALSAPRDESAWLFYEDRAPNALFEHGGRVVLVGRRSGAARVSAVVQGPPVVGGVAARFLGSTDGAYMSFRPAAKASHPPRQPAPTAPPAPISAPPSLLRAAQQLAAQRVCFVRAADTLGGFAPSAAAGRSGSAFGRLVSRLSVLTPGIVSGSYRTDLGTSPGVYTQGLIDANGCREVSLYLAGGGYRVGDETAVVVGTRVAGDHVLTQLVTAADLGALLRSRPTVWWNLTIDAPHAGALLDELRDEPNLASAQVSGRADDRAYIAGKPAAPGKRMLKFSRGLLGGLGTTLADEAAVAAAIGDRDDKRAPSFLAALLSRGFDSGIRPRPFAALGVEPQSFLRAGLGAGPGGSVAGIPVPISPIDNGPAPAINKPPTIVAGATALAYAENDPASPVDPTLSVSDSDSTQLTGATVTVSSDYVNGADELGFAPAGAIGGSWDAATGVLTLSGSASVADYQAALRTVTYRNASDDPVVGPRSIAFRAGDGKDESAAAVATVDVTAENDAPDTQLASGSASYTENGAAAPIDSALSVVDPDSADLDSATVAITAGLHAAEDQLELTAPVAGITASYDAPTGVLNLTGPASRADFQSALRAVAYRNLSADPNTATRTVSITLTDSDAATGPSRNRDVTVAAVDNAPEVTVAATALAYAENDPATAVDPTLTVTDSDSAQLTGATITVAAGYLNGADELDFVDAGAISGAWDAASGVLTLSGSAGVAEYQAALRTVTYANGSDDPVAGPRSIAFRAGDGGTESAVATRTIDVTAANDAPELVLPAAGSLAYGENDPATAIDPGATLTDPDSADFSAATVAITAGLHAAEDRLELTTPVTGITASYDAPTGVLNLTGPASRADFQSALRAVAYRNLSENPDTATRTVSLQADDSDGAGTPTRTRNVTIGAVDNAPTVTTSATPLAYAENDPATALDPALTVSDPDSPKLVKATVRLSSGYTQGEDQLAFPGAAGISAGWDAATGTLTLTGSASPAAYQAALRTVTYANTSDNPVAGARTVTVQAEDATGAGNLATRSIEVSISNDAPTAQLAGGSAAYTENAVATPIDATLTVVDPDSANIADATVAITAGLKTAEDLLELTTPVAGITASYDAPTGVLTLTGPASKADFQTALRAVGYRNLSENPDTATRTVAVTLTDTGGATGVAHTRNVSVTTVNDTPVAVDDNAGSTDEVTVLSAAAPGLLGNDTDVEGDTLTVVAVNGLSAKVGVATTTTKGGAVTVNANGSYSYDPSGSATLRALGEGETDTDSFTYTAKDGSLSSTATVTVTVIGLPDPPVAGDDSYSGVGNTTLAVGQNGPSGEAFKQVSGSVLDNDTDLDTPANGLSVSAKTTATSLGGSATIAADGKFTYTPPAGTTGSTDSFDYTVSDGKQTDTGIVQIALSGRVWYVDNDRAVAGSGRSSSPFDTLAAAATASSAGDTIYVHQGDGSSAKQNAGVTLKANQQLLGEAVDLVIGGDTLFDGSAAQRPTIGNSAGVGVTLASGSRVEGLKVAAAGGKAISAGSGVAGSAIADVVAIGSAGGVGLSGTSGTFAISDLAVTTSGGTGFSATNAGTVQFANAGAISISATGGPALDASGSALGGTIDTLSVPSSSSGGVALLNTTGSLAFGDVSITTSGGTGFSANNVTGLSVPAAGTDNVSSTGGPALDIRSLELAGARLRQRLLDQQLRDRLQRRHGRRRQRHRLRRHDLRRRRRRGRRQRRQRHRHLRRRGQRRQRPSGRSHRPHRRRGDCLRQHRRGRHRHQRQRQQRRHDRVQRRLEVDLDRDRQRRQPLQQHRPHRHLQRRRTGPDHHLRQRLRRLRRRHRQRAPARRTRSPAPPAPRSTSRTRRSAPTTSSSAASPPTAVPTGSSSTRPAPAAACT